MTFTFKFLIFQSEHIVRIIDARILDGWSRSACILIELGDMDFDKYLQSPDAASARESENHSVDCSMGERR